MTSEQTSVRLSRQTRDAVNRLARQRGVTADRAIADAIATTRWEADRRRAELETREWAQDPAYREEIAAALHDLGEDEE
jgi:predicted transcriptional regulator